MNLPPPRAALAAVIVVLTALAASGASASPAADLASARLLQSRAQWAAAESLANVAALGFADAHPVDSLALADAWFVRGNAHQRYAGYADGRALADGSLALGVRTRHGAPAPALAEIELLLGRVLQGSARTDSALVHLKRAVDLRTAALAADDTLIAEAWDQLALCRRDRREYTAALDAWDHAIQVRARSDGMDSPAVALLQAQTGACWMELGDRARARQVLEGSLATFARAGQPDHPSRWVPLNILADLEFREGNPARDIDLLQEALRIVRLTYGDRSRQALTLRWNLVNAFYSFQDFAGARTSCEELEPLMAAQYGPSSYRTLLVRQALALSVGRLGDPPAALRIYAGIESVLVANPSGPSNMLSAVQKDQADLLHRMGRDREALAMCDRARRSALATPPVSGQDLGETYFVRIKALSALGDTAALAQARRGLDTLEARFGHQPGYFPSTLPSFKAFADARLGRRDLAWSEALEAEQRAHENSRQNLRRLSDRRSLQYTWRAHIELDQVLELSAGDTSRTAIAWDRLVRARGLIGTELAQRAVPAGLEGDSAVVGPHQRWRSAQETLARLMVRGGGADSAARAALERARSDAEEAERRYAAALAGRGAGAPPGEYGLADLRARLSSRQALVSLVGIRVRSDTMRVIAFVARGATPQLRRIELGRAIDLARSVEAWRLALATPPSSDRSRAAAQEREARARGEAVRAMLWKPIAGAVGDAAEMFVAADGALADLPWDALPEGGGRYWAEAGPLVHPLDTERSLMEPRAAPANGRLLAIGSPDFDRLPTPAGEAAPLAAAVVRSAPDPCAATDAIALAPLPGSGIEADSVALAWRRSGAGPADVLRGAAAGESEFKRDAPGCETVHIATHGVMRGDRCAGSEIGLRGVGGVSSLATGPAAAPATSSPAGGTGTGAAATFEPSPWLSRRVWLAFAGANQAASSATSENEGYLTAEEVATLDLIGTDWVVLSACQSGAGDVWSTDGRLGMRRAFALAGVRSVIASAWALGDATTIEWMAALYDARLHQGADAAAAVHAANRRVLAARRASGRPTHPFYWAAFTSSDR